MFLKWAIFVATVNEKCVDQALCMHVFMLETASGVVKGISYQRRNLHFWICGRKNAKCALRAVRWRL